jgi:ribonuclease HI
MKIEMYFDGACFPINPGGTASYGVVIYKDGESIKELIGTVGEGKGMTNNVAEYEGLINGLRWIRDNLREGISELKIYGDSNLVINMVTKKWGWKKKKYLPHLAAPHLLKLLRQCHELLKEINVPTKLEWIPREQNAIADELSKDTDWINSEEK